MDNTKFTYKIDLPNSNDSVAPHKNMGKARDALDDEETNKYSES